MAQEKRGGRKHTLLSMEGNHAKQICSIKIAYIRIDHGIIDLRLSNYFVCK